eukprot:jgi/Mesvir1/12816/Mv04889-RA.1
MVLAKASIFLQTQLLIHQVHASCNATTVGYIPQSNGLQASKGGALACKPSVSANFWAVARHAARSREGGSRQVTKMMPIGVPRMPYKTPGETGMQWVDLWNIFYRERVIFIGQTINEEFSNNIVATLLYLDSVNNKPLTFYINCPGGEVLSTLAIYDTIRHIRSPVNTMAFGHAYSMGAFLVAAGQKGKRGALPHTNFMIHAPEGVARGQASDMVNETRELLRLQEYLLSEFSKNTGQPMDKLKEDLTEKGNVYMSAEQAIEYGVLDLIVRPRRGGKKKNLMDE